jgi:hypothetical protein
VQKIKTERSKVKLEEKISIKTISALQVLATFPVIIHN